MKKLLIVGLGGAVGSILRYLVTLLTSKYYANPFPLATFLSNILGCILIGLFISFFSQNVISNNYKLFLITGICGGFTTFSAFSSENIQLLQNGNYLTAYAYIFSSIIFGLLAVYIGLNFFKN